MNLHCPNCHTLLTKGEDQKFETLGEHVSNPNMVDYPLRETWVCKNKECLASKEDLFWDSSGDLYGFNKNFKFKNDLDSAYPSIARKLDIEIYKKGLKSSIYLSPVLMLWVLQPIIEFNYKADDYGNVLNKSWKLKWLKKDKFGYNIYYTFPLVNIVQSLKYEHSKLKNSSKTYIGSQREETFKPLASWDKRWWRHTTLFLIKIIFNKEYSKYRKRKK